MEQNKLCFQIRIMSLCSCIHKICQASQKVDPWFAKLFISLLFYNSRIFILTTP